MPVPDGVGVRHGCARDGGSWYTVSAIVSLIAVASVSEKQLAS
ncbi:hypothetical protein Rhow_005263 [Rhodococcus wratislaviensis]|uniref:Uncharacterized protein n=1 Tax=Rhodococcus wratislaviensis TaxID=44752 RepID=A0A402CDC8_RHOWR|nr:hypothetical protein Rhow_005263 [Rhodococcus wratislaviensis]